MKSKKGMTLFISIVIMGILLFISFAVVNITLKSTLFTSYGRESQYAFYAADAGLECALYWDTRFDPSKFDSSVSGSPISCGGVSIFNGQAIPGTTTPTALGGRNVSVFYFPLSGGSNPTNACAVVTVIKNPSGGTFIKSRGYNTCDTSSSDRTERGVEATY